MKSFLLSSFLGKKRAIGHHSRSCCTVLGGQKLLLGETSQVGQDVCM